MLSKTGNDLSYGWNKDLFDVVKERAPDAVKPGPLAVRAVAKGQHAFLPEMGQS